MQLPQSQQGGWPGTASRRLQLWPGDALGGFGLARAFLLRQSRFGDVSDFGVRRRKHAGALPALLPTKAIRCCGDPGQRFNVGAAGELRTLRHSCITVRRIDFCNGPPKV